ncbi:MAG: outer membrane protein [Tabrizicola sp.]
MRIALAAVLALSAGAAQAGGPVVVAAEPQVAAPATPAPAGWDWTGFYVGLGVTSGNLTAGSVDDGTNGYEVHAGYLHDFGRLVAGVEVGQSKADVDLPVGSGTVRATRFKLIGGVDANRVLPYAFVGVSDVEISSGPLSISDSVTGYGIGARVAIGAAGRLVAGLEYSIESSDDFAGPGNELDYKELSLRIDYRF